MKNKFLLGVGAVLIMVAASFVFGPQPKAAAASMCYFLVPAANYSDPPQKDDCLNGQQSPTALYDLRGLSGDAIKRQFISDMKAYANSDKQPMKYGGQYIIDTLSGGEDFDSLVMQENVTLHVEYFTYAQNSGYNPYPEPHIDFYGADGSGGATVESLVIEQDGELLAVIKLDCGNPLNQPPKGISLKKWHLSSTSQSRVEGSSYQDPGVNAKPAPSKDTDVVDFKHVITNDGPDTAENVSWRIEGCYAAAGDTCTSDEYGPAQGGGGADMGSGLDDKVVKGNNVGGITAPITYKFAWKSGHKYGDRYCQRIAYNKGDGPNDTDSYGSHSNGTCAILAKPGEPTGTIACSKVSGLWTITTTENINDPDHDGPYSVALYKDGAKMQPSPVVTTSSSGSLSANVDSYVPAGSTHTFYVYIFGVNSSNVKDDTDARTNTVSCGAPAPSGDCAGQNLAPQVTLPKAKLPSHPGITTDTTGPPGSSNATGPYTTQANAQYYQEDPGDYRITKAQDQYTPATGIGWTSTGYQPSATFTLDYANYKTDYPYDDHTTTITYNQQFDETYWSTDSTVDFYSCPGGGTYNNDGTCKYDATKSTNNYSACPSGSFYANEDNAPDSCLTYAGVSTSPSTHKCPAGYYRYPNNDTATSCYTRSTPSCNSSVDVRNGGTCTHTTYSCNSGDAAPNSNLKCFHPATKNYYWNKGTPVNDIDGPDTTYSNANPQPSANSTFLGECYDRAFTVQSVRTDAGLYPDSEDPDYGKSSATVTVAFDYPADGPHTSLRNPMTVTLSYSSLECSGSAGSSFTVTGSNAPGTGTAIIGNIVPGCQFTAPPHIPGESACATYTVAPAGSHMKWNGTVTQSSGSVSDRGCSEPISNQPYAHFFGLDVSAGGSFESNNNECTTAGPQPSGIAAFVKGSGPLTRGSATQFGALALGPVDRFGSASLRSSTPTARDGLTFANKDTLGNLGGTHCVPDYFATNPLATPDVSGTSISLDFLNGVGGGDTAQAFYYGDGNTKYTINGFGGGEGIANGNRVAIYVNGDVYIQNDIDFKSTNWNSASSIPSFYLVVKGNIYIGAGVHQLDGVYVAQPGSNGGGTINTCGTSSFGRYRNDQLFGACNSQLVVNGAFIAQNVQLSRTFASLRNSIGGEYPASPATAALCTPGDNIKASSIRSDKSYDCAAEVFNFSPETYLSRPAISPTSDPSDGKFDYITTLSPVL